MTLEYNGAAFHGWQTQPDVRNIQDELERVLNLVLRTRIRGLCASGRTDAGVHARGQVVNFLVECGESARPSLDLVRRSVSSLMKPELCVLSAEFVPENFSARFDAVAKQYSYRVMWRDVPPVLEQGLCWHISGPLDLERMRREAASVVGVHDFSSFRSVDCGAESAVREIFESEFLYCPPFLTYRVTGNGFLKQMVRNLAGTLVWIGRGKIRKSMCEILEARDRREAGVAAPACGLTLDWVRYREDLSVS